MGTNITGNEIRTAAHLAVVDSPGVTDLSAAFTSRTSRPPAISGGVSYGAAVASTGGVSPQRKTAVELVAARFDKFEDALFSMVVASGIDPSVAEHIEAAILKNDGLRTQAQNAFHSAKRRTNMGPIV